MGVQPPYHTTRQFASESPHRSVRLVAFTCQKMDDHHPVDKPRASHNESREKEPVGANKQ